MKNKKRVNTPVVLQMEAVECGAASLGIILSYYGLFLPLERLRVECGVSRDGSKAINMLKAARQLGMDASGYRYTAEDIKDQEYPLIIHWNFNHFLVLEGIQNGKVYLNDPGSGHQVVTWEEFESSFTGIALKITPGTGFQKGGERPNLRTALFSRLRGQKSSLAFIVLIGLGLIVPGLAIPVFSQVFLDDILTFKHADWLFNLMLAMGLTMLLQVALTWLRSWCLTRWQGSLTIGESGRYFWHLLHLPIEFFQQRFAGEVASRVQFNESVASVLTGQAATAVLDIAVALFYLLLLFEYNATLTFIGLVFTSINMILLRLMFRWSVEQQMKSQQDFGKAYGVAISGVQLIETIKANGTEGDFFAKWAGYQSKLLETTQKIETSVEVFLTVPTLLSGLNTAMIMAFGGFQIMDGLMTAGIFFAFQSLMGKFQEPLTKILTLSQSLQTTEMQIHRLDDVLRYPRDVANFPDVIPGSIGKDKLSGRVELKHVTFGYSHLEAPLFEDFSLVIEPGRRVALIGGSGSGKSTVAKLVAGLYQPWSGEILLDGIPRNQIPREVITHSLAVVDQDIFLFAGTVTDNISLFDNSITRDDIIRASKDAAIHDSIAALQGGYDAVVEEGGRNFSGGQRQRMEIARALAGNPSILVLDEATSALDPLVEQTVADNIRRRGCACLVVAHRLSTIRDCDEIIVMSYGKVVQRGRHEDMRAAEGPYKQLIENSTGQANHRTVHGG